MVAKEKRIKIEAILERVYNRGFAYGTGEREEAVLPENVIQPAADGIEQIINE